MKSTHIFKTASRLVLILCVLVTSACAAQPSGQVLIAWHTLDDRGERALLKLVDRYNATNRDGIVIVPERRARDAQHDALLAGAAPHLALVSQAQAATYDQRGLLTQLDNVIAADKGPQRWDEVDRADLFPFMFIAGRNGRGQLIGVPWGGDARVLLRNSDWAAGEDLGEMPATWEQFDASCKAAVNPVSGSVCFSLGNENVFLEEWVSAHGATPYANESNSLLLNSPQMVAATERLFSYLQSGAAYRAQTPRRALEDFAAGRVGYLTTWSSQLDEVATAIRERGNFNIDIGVWPAPAGDAKPVSIIESPLWVVPKGSPERELSAWRFIHWMLEDVQTAQWEADTGEVPARSSAVNALNLDADQSTDVARAAVLFRVAPNARPAPLLAGWPCVQAEVANSLRQIFEGQSITDALTLAQLEALDVMNTDCSTQ